MFHKYFLNKNIKIIVILLILFSFIFISLSQFFFSETSNKNDLYIRINNKIILINSIDKKILRFKKKLNIQKNNFNFLKDLIIYRIIIERTLENYLRNLGFVVSANSLDKSIIHNSKFQVDGLFSRKKFSQFLKKYYYTSKEIISEIYRKILIKQISNAIKENYPLFSYEKELTRKVLNQKKNNISLKKYLKYKKEEVFNLFVREIINNSKIELLK